MRALVIAAIFAATPVVAQDAARGAYLFEQHCAVCHGTGLRGTARWRRSSWSRRPT
jgi:mono/diheme cytochrome c family protein